MDNYDLNWGKVKYTDTAPDRYKITLPDLKLRDGSLTATNINIQGHKHVGDQRGFVADVTIGNVTRMLIISTEILSIKREGVVFLIGFAKG